jgi:hypothetical protein
MQNPLDVFGLSPLPRALAQARTALLGMEGVPPSRFGMSSLGIFFPRLAVETWLGRRPGGDRVLVTNLFNHTQTPIADGWSVRKTQNRDFRGRRMTYDSHNGTDFTCPVGTTVTAPAPGLVVRVSSEFHRGGLKVVIDHGDGLMTTSNHLMKALVAPGQRVTRGEPIALSGASGIDCVAAFPWNSPHVHFNTWLGGVPVDPFDADPTLCLWRGGQSPGPAGPLPDESEPAPTRWHRAGVEALIASCQNAGMRAELDGLGDDDLRAANAVFYRNYFPTLFAGGVDVVGAPVERTQRLDLPFSDFSGLVFADSL